MPGALQTDKLGDVLEVLAENVLAASREHRHGADAELEQLLFAVESFTTSTAMKSMPFFERNSFVLRQLLQPGWVNKTSLSLGFSMPEWLQSTNPKN
jgi:hypothetical protein